MSSDIGRIGLLEHENAAIMNACLRDLSAHVIDAFRKAISETGIKGKFFLTQNDGTLMDASFAEKFPVLTFASGPTNSMRGAAFPSVSAMPSSLTSAARPPTSARSTRAFHARQRLRSRSVVCAPTSACPMSSRSVLAVVRMSSKANSD
jgi:hypothetical protein